MTRLKKELTDRGILYEADDYWVLMHGIEHDWCRKLVDITDQFIITVMYSAVLDTELHIFDRNTFELVAQQNLYPDPCGVWKENPWCSYVNFEA